MNVTKLSPEQPMSEGFQRFDHSFNMALVQIVIDAACQA